MTNTVQATEYEFSVDWFSQNIPVWEQIFDQLKPKNILEIGAYEGRSTVWLIENLTRAEPVSLYCVDTWQGGVEHSDIQMADVEKRFLSNLEIALEKRQAAMDVWICKGPSDKELVSLLQSGKRGYFDFVYIDGGHQAPDVLRDLILAFDLCKVGGVIAVDDYLWSMEAVGQQDLLNMPKFAIDCFTNVFQRKILILKAPLSQIYFRKVSD